MINKELRRKIVEDGYKLKTGHYGSIMSCLDVIKELYDNVLEKDDIFILSKGHGGPALQAVLNEKGYNPKKTIHLEYEPKEGIMATTGSLGHGLPMAVGRAFAKKIKGKGRVFVMTGDGEMQEGSNWEALDIAQKLCLDNLILLIDNNKYQAIDSIEKILNQTTEIFFNKLTAFGIRCSFGINGHKKTDLEKLKHLSNFSKISENKTPTAIILDTIKGYGIPFLEKNPTYHVFYMHEYPKIYRETMEHLK